MSYPGCCKKYGPKVLLAAIFAPAAVGGLVSYCTGNFNHAAVDPILLGGMSGFVGFVIAGGMGHRIGEGIAHALHAGMKRGSGIVRVSQAVTYLLGTSFIFSMNLSGKESAHSKEVKPVAHNQPALKI